MRGSHHPLKMQLREPNSGLKRTSPAAFARLFQIGKRAPLCLVQINLLQAICHRLARMRSKLLGWEDQYEEPCFVGKGTNGSTTRSGAALTAGALITPQRDPHCCLPRHAGLP